jgi:hypothetical protein
MHRNHFVAERAAGKPPGEDGSLEVVERPPGKVAERATGKPQEGEMMIFQRRNDRT